jgi:hypothetical protein
MASTHWFTTAMLVAGLSTPALGQTGPPSTTPLRDSIAREATLLAGQTANAPRATAQWSRVRSLQPGERILVTLSAGPTLQRSFLAADDATITLLNDSNPALPEETGRDLRRLAATRPRSLLIIPMGGTLRLDRLRIDPRGAFLDGNRIGDVSIIVELHSQDEIVEIALAEWSAPKRFWQYLLGWPGLVGFTGGVASAAYACETRRPCTVSDRAVVISGTVGAVAAAFAARHMDRRTRDGIVYRRPNTTAPYF